MSIFIDRVEELNKLFEIAKSKRAELVLLYGRRRIGKSRLLIEFAKKTGALYLLADISKNVLEILSNQIKDEFVKFNNWEDFFKYIYKCKYDVIIIDEFQYLYHVNKAWPTQLQRWWEKIKETNKKIILCGSIISTIHKIAKGYGSALYGRKTYEIHLRPLKFKYISGFLKHYSFEDLVKAYSVLGGVPRYLEEFDPKLNVYENIKRKILDKTSFLYNEPMNLFFEEFRNPSPYVSILLAIVQGYSRFHDIATFSKIENYKLPKYLLVLERVGILRKDHPITEKKIKTKTTRYKIKDNFYSFWFKFVFKNKAMIEQGLENDVFKSIIKEFNSYVGKCFESVCMELFQDLNIFSYTNIGNWWHKDNEIDFIAINNEKNEIMFVECKWQDKVNALKIASELSQKSKHVLWNNDSRKESYAVFAKSFAKKITEFEGKPVHCLDLADLSKALKGI